MDLYFLNSLTNSEKVTLIEMNQENQTAHAQPYPCMQVPVTCPSDPSSMREIIYHMAAMQPVEWIDPESIKPPKRRNVKTSEDPQSVAARLRRERISEKMRTLQRLVPGGTKMDTASMLDEAVNYMRFLKHQVQLLQMEVQTRPSQNFPSFSLGAGGGGYFSGLVDCQGSASSGSDSV